jgi:hypothetical protein
MASTSFAVLMIQSFNNCVFVNVMFICVASAVAIFGLAIRARIATAADEKLKRNDPRRWLEIKKAEQELKKDKLLRGANAAGVAIQLFRLFMR